MSRSKRSKQRHIEQEIEEMLKPGFVLDIEGSRLLVFKTKKWIDLSHNLLQAFLVSVGAQLDRWDNSTYSSFWYI